MMFSTTSGNVIRIERAQVEDRDEIVTFLQENWRADHIFVQRPEWLDWQHLSAIDGQYHILLARKRSKGNVICGFLGVMPYFMSEHGKDNVKADIATGIWISTKDGSGGTGIRLFQVLEDIYKPASIFSLGVTAFASQVLQLLKHEVGVACHYYIKNTEIPIAMIAVNLKSQPPPAADNLISGRLKEHTNVDCLMVPGQTSRPHKPWEWYEWRFGGNAPYRYRYFSFETDDHDVPMAFVARVVSIGNARCLRIVEMRGDLFSPVNLGSALLDVLKRERLEYADLVIGLVKGSYPDHGWGMHLRQDKMILPNYFDPFAQKNVDLRFALKCDGPTWIFRGDGDQDRPNKPGPQAPSLNGKPV